MKKLYLTIDDSPSPYTDEMVDFLLENEIPAILFVRGAFLAENPGPIVRAIQKGYVIGNHLYSHNRTSEMSFVNVIEEIERTETLINLAYHAAGKNKEVKLLRFPHMDRGCGGQVVEYHKYAPHMKLLENIFLEGLRVNDLRPNGAMLAKKHRLQIFLQKEGYVQPFRNITHPFFTQTEMAYANDCLFTFSTADWMLTRRHQGNWPYKSDQDLIKKIEKAEYLNNVDSADIVLMHDDRENILGTMKTLLGHWMSKKARFQRI